jgi:MFS family permease
MFAVAAGLAINLIPEQFADTIVSAQALRFVIIAVLGLASGVIADRFGRKIPIIAGLILLGANFALLGFFGITETNVFIYLISSGAAWGLFFVVFLAVPGDLSYLGSREKFYALGYILPISIFFGLSSIPGSNIFATSLRVSQILSLIVLLSIIPVLRAKETLSTQKIRDRKMKEYADKIEDLLQESKKKDDKKTD